jgi:hypothetical protein
MYQAALLLFGFTCVALVYVLKLVTKSISFTTGFNNARSECSIELPNREVSDTTDDDSSSERWLHNHQSYFKELFY